MVNFAGSQSYSIHPGSPGAWGPKPFDTTLATAMTCVGAPFVEEEGVGAPFVHEEPML